MNKKLMMMFLFALVAAIVYSSLAAAIMPYEPYDDMIRFVTHANQYYSVTYDGEGEAIVSMRIDITNRDQDPLTGLLVEIPYQNILLFSVAENVAPDYAQECIRYVESCVEYGSGNTCVEYDFNGNCLRYETPCLRQGQVCQQYRTTGSVNGYTKLAVTPTTLAESVSLPIEFSAPVASDQSRTVLIMFKVKDLADKRAGVFHYEFDTARIPLLTRTVRVASNVPSGLIMDGVKSSVNYRSDFSLLESSLDKMSAGVADQAMYASYGAAIYSARGAVETADYLDPHESLVVKGKYATSWWNLHWDTVFYSILIIAVILGMVIFATKRLRSHVKKDVSKPVKKEAHASFTQPFLTGLYTTLAMLGVWIITIVMVHLGNEFLRRMDLWDVLRLLFVFISIVVSIALIIGIPVHMSKKYGGSLGLYTLLSILGWMFVLGIVVFIIGAILASGSPVYYALG